MKELGYLFLEQACFVLPYWVVGILIGSAISVFGKEKFNHFLLACQNKCPGFIGLFLASLIGVISPLCLYGTIPVAASLSEKGIKDYLLAAFMMSSVLLNPQLLIYTMALGCNVALLRFSVCLIGGMLAGFCVMLFFRDKPFFTFDKLYNIKNRDTNPDIWKRFIYNVGRNIKTTGPYFLLGIVLAALFLYFVPSKLILHFTDYPQAEVLTMVIAGIPFYICGGGTIPLLAGWMHMGLSTGATLAFTVSGAATKITNLSAVKVILGVKHFIYYVVFVCLFGFVAGLTINALPAEYTAPRIDSSIQNHQSHHNMKVLYER